MKKLMIFVLIATLTTTLFTGCKKDKGDPPLLPPAESMTIDFSNFTSLSKSGDIDFDQKGVNNSSYEFAYNVASFWKLILNVTLVVPVTSFKLAVDKDPVFLDNKTWQWSYDVTSANSTFNAKLTGQVRSADVLWKMYITKEGAGGFTDFLWFEGTSNLDGMGGQWILYESADLPDALLQIDWTKSGASIGTIKYSYIKNNSYKTSYIEYGLTNGALNAYYNVHYYNSVKFIDVNVEWNITEKNGRVKCFDYLGDNIWHCWDSNKLNLLVCP